MKPTALLAFSVLFVAVPLGCTGGDGVQGIRNLDVQPRQPQRTDRWCVYTTTAASDEGAIPAQSDLCILCESGETACAASVRTITVAPGITYNVGIGGEASCGRCPEASQERGWTYERR